MDKMDGIGSLNAPLLWAPLCGANNPTTRMRNSSVCLSVLGPLRDQKSGPPLFSNDLYFFWAIWTILGPWSYWSILGTLGHLGHFGPSGPFWVCWPFWAILGHSGPFWVILGPLGHFGLFWAILGLFRPFWAILGHSGPFWALWAILGYIGPFWASWTHLHGSHGLSARRARSTKSRKLEGPKGGPKGRRLEAGARAPEGPLTSSAL